ncbi:MAG: hypothetical protein JWN44_3174 [Myxococcales bacterium]|nr:hypothetical protein [Myxococcales bacterium]
MIGLLVVTLLAPSGALVRLPAAADLVAAVRSGDDVEIERIAGRLGAVRLLRLAEKGKGPERLAALRALPLVDDGWAVLPDLSRLISDGDEEVAARAADCARRIAEGMTPELKERQEMPGDIPARAADELSKLAKSATLKSPLRVTAIQALAALRGVARVDEKALGALLTDPDKEIRHAAAEALAGASAGEKPLGDALANDSAKDVAAAAAAALCRDVPLIAPTGKPGSAALQPEARAARMGAAARERLRKLALDDEVPLADRLDLVPCLRVAKKDSDQKVLDELARRPPEAMRRRARALGGR